MMVEVGFVSSERAQENREKKKTKSALPELQRWNNLRRLAERCSSKKLGKTSPRGGRKRTYPETGEKPRCVHTSKENPWLYRKATCPRCTGWQTVYLGEKKVRRKGGKNEGEPTGKGTICRLRQEQENTTSRGHNLEKKNEGGARKPRPTKENTTDSKNGRSQPMIVKKGGGRSGS